MTSFYIDFTPPDIFEVNSTAKRRFRGSSWRPRHLEEVGPLNQPLKVEPQTIDLDSKNLSSGTERDDIGVSEPERLDRNSSRHVHALRHLRVQPHRIDKWQHRLSGRVTPFFRCDAIENR